MDRDADALYGLPRDEFIARRGELAKTLRKDGRREDAAAVAALRKPSVAAWAVNQLVRTQRSSVQELLDAGDALRDAQADLLAGHGDAGALRVAGDRERAAVDDLVDRARGLPSSAGDELSPAVIERVAETLHAAALDENAREQVRDGRLERELRHVGLGLGLGESGPVAPAPRRPRPRPADAAAAQGDVAPGAAAPKGGGPGRESAAAEAKRGAATAKQGGARSKRRAGRAAEPGAAATPDRGGGESKRAAATREREQAEAERAAAQRARRERVAAVKAARAAQVAAKRRADVATRVLTAAEAQREQAAQVLSDAEDALAAAREDAASAGKALRHAQAEREAAERRR